MAADGPAGSRVELLGIYLNDHIAGSTAGLALFRRTAGAHRGTPLGDALTRLAQEVEEDRHALLAVTRALGVPVRRYKVAAGWVVERVGRLKSNGRLVRRSPLSGVLELEALVIAVEGKAAGWRTLRALADDEPRLDPRRLDELQRRARRQSVTLEDLRAGVVRDVLRS